MQLRNVFLLLIVLILNPLYSQGKSSHSVASLKVFDINQSVTEVSECIMPINGQYALSSPLTLAQNIKQDIRATNNFKLAFYFILWYSVTIVYSTTNKIVLNQLPLPITMAISQLFLGIPTFLPFWLYNRPIVTIKELKGIAKIGAMHGLGNVVSVISLGAGAVSFTHIVKAAEPVFAAFLSAIFLKSTFTTNVYLSLLPIIFGVSLASLKELSFSWLSFSTAMSSNLFNQLRMIISKKELNGNQTKLKGATLFQVMTIFAAFEMLPLLFFTEGPIIQQTWKNAIASGINSNTLIFNIIITGITYYLSNEISFWILDEVHPITHAVGNTVKRIVLIIASVIAFHTPINSQGIIGSAIAIIGTFLYSVAMQKADEDKKQAALNK